MKLFCESLNNTGFTTADLSPGGKSSDLWPKLQQGLIERAQTKVQISASTLNR